LAERRFQSSVHNLRQAFCQFEGVFDFIVNLTLYFFISVSQCAGNIYLRGNDVLREPPFNVPILTTAGSNGSKRRETMAFNAIITCAAM